MQTGDILFFKSNGWISRFIAKVTGSPYTHVALVLDEHIIIEADRFIKSRIIEFKKDNTKIYKLMRLYRPLTESELENIGKYSGELEGRPYDYIGIAKLFARLALRINLSNIVNDTNSLWCSELVDYVFDKSGIDLVPQIKTWEVTPREIEDSPVLIEVEGGI